MVFRSFQLPVPICLFSSSMSSPATLSALKQETYFANRSEINAAERDYYAAKSGAKVGNHRASIE